MLVEALAFQGDEAQKHVYLDLQAHCRATWRSFFFFFLAKWLRTLALCEVPSDCIMYFPSHALQQLLSLGRKLNKGLVQLFDLEEIFNPFSTLLKGESQWASSILYIHNKQ